MNLSKQLFKLSKIILAGTREGFWGLGSSVVHFIEKELPVNFLKTEIPSDSTDSSLKSQEFHTTNPPLNYWGGPTEAKPSPEKSWGELPVTADILEEIYDYTENTWYSLYILVAIHEGAIPEERIKTLMQKIQTYLRGEGLTAELESERILNTEVVRNPAEIQYELIYTIRARKEIEKGSLEKLK